MAAPGFVMLPGWVFDAGLSTAGKLVYAALLRYRDSEGTCYPSHRRLAVMTSTSPRTVQRALTELRDAGHVAWEARETEAGGPTSNLYTLADPYATVADPPATLTDPLGQPDVGATPEGPDPYATVADEVDLLELDLPNETRGTTPSDRFDEFWAVYPKKVSKPDALKAWTTATKRADPQDVIDGARRYAEDPNREPGFTKNPGTWLRNDCWDDGPIPARRRGGQQSFADQLVHEVQQPPALLLEGWRA